MMDAHPTARHGQNPDRRQSTREQRENWAPACSPGAYVRVELHGEGRVTVDKRCVAAVEALSAVLAKHGYETRRADTGAYNCRPITGGTGYSLHAYGIALDINWTTNPYGKRLVTDMPRAMVDEILAITTTNGARVWEWGGDWSGNKDAMHYEIDCTPADLATGLQGHDEGDEMTKDELDKALAAALKPLDDRLAKVERAVVGTIDDKGQDRIKRLANDLDAIRNDVGVIRAQTKKEKP